MSTCRRDVARCHQVSPGCHRMSRKCRGNVAKCRKMSRDVAQMSRRCRRVSPSVARCRRDVAGMSLGCRGMSRDVARCHTVSVHHDRTWLSPDCRSVDLCRSLSESLSELCRSSVGALSIDNCRTSVGPLSTSVNLCRSSLDRHYATGVSICRFLSICRSVELSETALPRAIALR